MLYTCYMIVYTKSEKRITNYNDIKIYFKNLNKFDAIDGLNEYTKYKEIVLKNNYLSHIFFTVKCPIF